MATYYINADSGDDTTGDGSSGSPWKTINKAHTSSVAADTIILQDATAIYQVINYETMNDRVWTAQTTGNPVVSDLTSTLNFININGTTTITGIVFQGLQQQSNTFSQIFYSADASGVATFTDCIFKDNTFGDTPYSGIAGARTPISNISFIGCLFYNNIYETTAPTIYGYFGKSLNLTLTNCTVYISETSTKCPAKLITGDASMTITMKNTIIHNTSGKTIDWTVNTSTNDVTYSDISNITGSPSGTGTITSDPLFIDQSNNDFRLRQSSPCIDTGTIV